MARIVIVGAGVAGMKTLEALRTGGYDGELTLVGAESHLPYDRPPLSKHVLRGEREPVFLRAPQHWDALHADVRLGVRAAALEQNSLVLTNGERLAFDQAVVATGAGVRTLPQVPALPGVHYLRTLDDCLALKSALGAGIRVVIIGAGFLGCEVAASAVTMGAAVTIVEPQDEPLAGPLGPELAAEVFAVHRDRGVHVLTGVGVAAVAAADARCGPVASVTLTDGRVLPAEVVLVAVGVRPETEWLAGSAVAVEDGVVTDEHLRTAQSNVFAVGDVARFYDVRTGATSRTEHWTNATEMAEVAAINLLGGGAVHSPVPYFWTDQYDLKVQVLGWTAGAQERRVLRAGPKERRVVLYGREGGLWAVAGVNAAAVVRRHREAIIAHAPLDDVAAHLND